MKINNTDETLKSIYGETSKKNEKTDDNQFAEILKKTLSPTDESKPVYQNHQILRSTPLPDIQPLKALGTDKSTIVERVHNFLDVLDDYRRKLGDPRVSLKEVDPVINRLEIENENLKPVLESLGDEDELKEILNNLLINASLEVIRYRQGEYINSK